MKSPLIMAIVLEQCQAAIFQEVNGKKELYWQAKVIIPPALLSSRFAFRSY